MFPAIGSTAPGSWSAPFSVAKVLSAECCWMPCWVQVELRRSRFVTDQSLGIHITIRAVNVATNHVCQQPNWRMYWNECFLNQIFQYLRDGKHIRFYDMTSNVYWPTIHRGWISDLWMQQKHESWHRPHMWICLILTDAMYTYVYTYIEINEASIYMPLYLMILTDDRVMRVTKALLW